MTIWNNSKLAQKQYQDAVLRMSLYNAMYGVAIIVQFFLK